MSHHQQQSSNGHDDDDLNPTTTAGYRVGEKKTMDQYNELDANDESLRRWKESLGIPAASAAGAGNDPHNVQVMRLALQVEGRPDVILDLTQSDDLIKKHPFTIKEGVEYRLRVEFHVRNSIVSGLKYLHVVKRKGMRVDKMEAMIGSYAASPDLYTKIFQTEDAPSGILFRGSYDVKSKFIDDDGTVHREWNWSFDIKKDW
ncbi:hypothetical protein DFQ27_009151 [Actinomortierella ambigua]|uniref:Rho GDP-dissociation inhibitor n=1 Tax=Actinomortierella ambigua TaxID=1343610 RepID=A0A9P6UAV8_9FUNG|nr:hypothetical protein DFQ26_007147 [Actinomortierella ambigua]KAG0267131.1 hypothetical protein DFQ27_009151 [Actinomortierella ambigua]